MLYNTRVERLLSEAKRCRFQSRCLLRHYALGTLPKSIDGCVHCLAYHEVFDQPGGDYDYLSGLIEIYTNTEHVSCGIEEV